MAEGGIAPQGLNIMENEARTVDGGTSSKTVEVTGFSLGTIQDVLEMYFENSRRSGGGDIEEFEIKDDAAYITFEEGEVAQRVVSRSPHRVASQTLTATMFCPPLQKPCYENRILVLNLNSAVTEQLLTNFLETETGIKVTEFLYGEEEGKVVVTFSDFIDFAVLRKACKERGIQGTFLQVGKVAISNCIFVKNLQPFVSHDVILFYFENKRRSGGGDIERVEMNMADSYCLVYFEDCDVIDSVLCKQHRIDGADIKVHLHHECLGRKSSRSRFDPFFGISKSETKESLLKAETSSTDSSNPDKGCDFSESLLKAETSSNVSSNPGEGSDFVDTPKWQEDDGKNCVLALWIKYKRVSERTIIKDMRKVPCSWNFRVFWNFFTKTKQGKRLLADILKRCGCSVTVSSDDDDLFIFEISDENFEKESGVTDFIKDALSNVYASAKQFLFCDIFLVDHRLLEDILQKVKQTKEMDSAWIGLVGEQEPDAIYMVCIEKDKESILKEIASIKAAVQDCFENHEVVVTIDPVWQKVLKRLGYLQRMSEKFPNLRITPDETKSVIMLKCARDQSSTATKHLMELLETAHNEVQEDIFSPGCQFDIFVHPEMCDYIDNCIIKLPFVWIPNQHTMKIHLFSKKSDQIMGMDKFVKGCIKERLYPLSKDQSLCCLKITRSLEELKKKHKGKIVFDQYHTGLILTTADDIFESVDAVVQEIIAIETEKVQLETCGERNGHFDNISKYQAQANQRNLEYFQLKRGATPVENTKDPKGLKNECNVGTNKLEVMMRHEMKRFSDGINKIEDRKKSGAKGAHTKSEEVASKPGYTMVIGLSESTSDDNLLNFMEGKSGADVKEIVYGPRRENAVVIFERKPDHANLQSKVSNKKLDGKVLEVFHMPPPTSIIVSTKNPKEFSRDTLTFHFESKKHGDAELVEDGIKITEDGCYIMTFTDSDAVERVCAMQHKVDNIPLNVSPYYQFKKWTAWNTAIHGINIPEPFVQKVAPILLKYLQSFPRAMKAVQVAMVEMHAGIELQEDAVLLTCLLNPEVKGCRKLMTSWRKDAEENCNKCLSSTFQIEKISNLSKIWKDFIDFVKSMIEGKEIMLVEERFEDYIQLVGFYEEVKTTRGEVMKIKKKLEHMGRVVKETMPLKSAAKKHLLDRNGICQLRAQFSDFDVHFEQTSEEIVLSGVPEDKNSTKLQIFEELRKFGELFEISNSTHHFNHFIKDGAPRNYIIKEMETNGLMVDWDVCTENGHVYVYCIPADCAQHAATQMKKMVREINIPLSQAEQLFVTTEEWTMYQAEAASKCDGLVHIVVTNDLKNVIWISMEGLYGEILEELKDFIKKNTVVEDMIQCNPITKKFMKAFWDPEDYKEIEKNSEDKHLQLTLQGDRLMVKGTAEGIQKAKELWKEKTSRIINKSHTLKRVGIKEVLMSEEQTGMLKALEMEHHCLIQTETSDIPSQMKISRDIDDNERVYDTINYACTVGKIKVQVYAGDILDEKTDAIVNSVGGDFSFQGGVANSLKKKCKGLEEKCKEKKYVDKLRNDAVVVMDISGLTCKKIMHVKFQEYLTGWKKIFGKCLKKAIKHKLVSLSFPLLGTGGGSTVFDPKKIAEMFFEALVQFDEENTGHQLQNINIVVFHKQPQFIPEIKKAMMKISHQGPRGTLGKMVDRVKDLGQSVIEGFLPRSGVVSPQPKPAASRSQMSIATIQVYSDVEKNIKHCIFNLEQKLDKAYISMCLTDELIAKMSKKELEGFFQTDLFVECEFIQEEKQVLIKGTQKHVFEALNLFHKKLMDKVRQENEKRDAEQLFQVVQWQFEDITEEGVNLVPYDELTNYRMEEAFKRGDVDLELKDPAKKKVYVVDFKTCVEYDREDDEDTVKIVRKDILKDKASSLPNIWMEMKPDENIRLVNIQNQDPEYTNLETTFITECKTGSYANRIPNLATLKVLKIQRIQNRTLYQQYAAKRQLMTQRYKDKQNFKVEWKAWHGTAKKNVESIYTHGFNRSYCGTHGVWFGQGVYFATNASCSARGWLAAGNQAPPPGTKQFIFYVSVCVGEYIKGEPKMRYLPAKDPNKPTDVYDSAVDDVNNVGEIVIFNDTQAYPDYLITFTT